MRRLQVEREMTVIGALIGSLSKSARKMRSLQAWHYLIPILGVFLTVFAVIVMITYLSFLALAVLAVLALFSVLIIGLAWAYQNDI